MFCPNCNTIISNDAKFCPNCGAQINMNTCVNSQPYAPSGTPNPRDFGSNGNNNGSPFVSGGTSPDGYSQNPYSNRNNEPSFNNRNTQDGYNNPCGYNPTPNPNMYNRTYAQPASNDKRSVGFGILSFLVPVLGLVLYLIWKDKLPERAKGCGIAALFGVVFAVIRAILYAFSGDFNVYYNGSPAVDDYIGLSALILSLF